MGHWANNFQNFVLFCSAGHRKSNLCVRRYFVTKNNMFQRKVFFYKRFRTLIGKVCTFEKNICLGSKTSILVVLRNVLGEKFCIKNFFFFEKFYRTLWEYFSDFRLTCFRQGWHHSILLLPRRVSGKNSAKKSLFHCFQTWSKKSTFGKTSGWMWKLYCTCPEELLQRNVLYQKALF